MTSSEFTSSACVQPTACGPSFISIKRAPLINFTLSVEIGERLVDQSCSPSAHFDRGTAAAATNIQLPFLFTQVSTKRQRFSKDFPPCTSGLR